MHSSTSNTLPLRCGRTPLGACKAEYGAVTCWDPSYEVERAYQGRARPAECLSKYGTTDPLGRNLSRRAAVFALMTSALESFDPQLLRSLRAAPWRSIERRFLVILAASMGLHLAFASYLAGQPMPVVTESSEQSPFKPQVLPPLHPLPKVADPVPTHGAPSRPLTPAVRPTHGVDRAKVSTTGILGLLNADKAQGALHDLLDPSPEALRTALDGASGRRVAADGPAGPRGPATGEAATVERMGTQGVKAVTLGARVEHAPLAHADGPIVIETTQGLNQKVLQQFIAARRAAVQSCYERALLHNPSLQGGRVVLRLVLGVTGKVTDLQLEEDTLGSEAVTSCMSTFVKRWVFPVSPFAEVPVLVPFIFARSN